MRVLLGFESMIPASERAKTLRALDRATTVTGCFTSLEADRDADWMRDWVGSRAELGVMGNASDGKRTPTSPSSSPQPGFCTELFHLVIRGFLTTAVV
jgi:hypothetical protein